MDIPNGVTKIGQNAFSGCKNITSITIPNSVTSIGSGAFNETNPTKVTLPFVGLNRTASGYEGVFGYIFGNTNYLLDSNRDIVTFQYKNGTSSYDTSYYYYIPKTIKEVVITNASRIPIGIPSVRDV